jgi:phosphate/sulfate permease
MEDLSKNPARNTGQASGQPERQFKGQNLGIAALITAIITFVLAVIPCVGFIAIIPGIIAIVLASVGLSQATRSDSPRGILIASLVIGIIAVMISFSQIFVVGKIFDKADKWPNKIEEIVDEVKQNVLKDLEDANVNIKIENGEEKVIISTGQDRQDKEKMLEELEKGNIPADDTLVRKE